VWSAILASAWLIAATAHAHSARLYTRRNADDFDGLDDLVDVVTV
jgi:predicted nucleic acid-binding protein